jgi:DNA-binding transcriptional MerR regulator
MEYTIKQIADLAGVSTRTLRYYDELGLLEPFRMGINGYRYYNEGNLLQLQQIMFFRELDVPLQEIEYILSRPDYNIVNALERHRQTLYKKVQRLTKLIDTIDRTIMSIHGEWTMSDNDYFEGFDETKYEKEAKDLWGGTDKYRESHRNWASYSESEKQAIKEKGRMLTLRMVTQNPDANPDDEDIQAAVGEYFKYLNQYFYTCDLAFFRKLADMWVEDLRFATNYERIREGGAEFVRKAVHIFCDTNA